NEDQQAVVESCAVAILLGGEALVAVAALKARKAGCLPRLQASEERLMGLVQSRQHGLQDLTVDGGILRERRVQVRRLGLRLSGGERHPTAMVRAVRRCCEGRVVEPTTAPHDVLKLTLPLGRWLEFVVVGFAQARLPHDWLSPFLLAADIAGG